MVLIFRPSGGGANNIFYLTVVLVIYISLPDGGGAVHACVDWCRFSTLCWWYKHIFIYCNVGVDFLYLLVVQTFLLLTVVL